MATQKKRSKLNFFFDNKQFVYGIVLLILVPAALVINTIVFINNTEKVLDIELQRKASLANSLFGARVSGLINDRHMLQNVIKETVKTNDEIYSLDVLAPDEEHFEIIASLDREVIGNTSKYVYNTLAWQTEEAIAYSTSSRALSTEDQGYPSDERFWVVVQPVMNDNGEKIALVSMKISSAVIDELAQQNIQRSVIVLIASIIVIVLLLLNNMRMFQYALLFRKLKEVDEMKDEFISMASHELRAPITGIRGYLQMTLENSFGRLPEEAHQKLTMVLQQTNNLNELVADLLDVSRIQQGRLKLETQEVLPSVAIENTVQAFSEQAKAKGLSLRANVPADLPTIYADEAKLRQIMVNIISNAIKYTDHGGISITADIKRTEGKEYVRIKVKDTGIGMSAKDRERLFEKFYRVRNDKTDKVSGTGLGLWITRELVRLMKGDIYVDSIEGTGTEVTFMLPVYKKQHTKK